MIHGGNSLDEDPRGRTPSATADPLRRRSEWGHAVAHTAAPAPRISTPRWCGPHQEGSSEDSCSSTPWSTTELQQRRFASPDGIAHTGIPAAVIPTAGWRGACRESSSGDPRESTPWPIQTTAIATLALVSFVGMPPVRWPSMFDSNGCSRQTDRIRWFPGSGSLRLGNGRECTCAGEA